MYWSLSALVHDVALYIQDARHIVRVTCKLKFMPCFQRLQLAAGGCMMISQS